MAAFLVIRLPLDLLGHFKINTKGQNIKHILRSKGDIDYLDRDYGGRN
jgi:hypothetical protein